MYGRQPLELDPAADPNAGSAAFSLATIAIACRLLAHACQRLAATRHRPHDLPARHADRSGPCPALPWQSRGNAASRPLPHAAGRSHVSGADKGSLCQVKAR